MMKRFLILTVPVTLLLSCSESFLDDKPNSNILTPETMDDFQRLLDNSDLMGHTSALPQLASDDYYIDSESNWLSARTAVERHSYIWDTDIYGGEVNIADWNAPFQTVFYVNNILHEIDRSGVDYAADWELGDVYGQALFQRAKVHYDLLKNFSVPFDSETQETDLGIPLREDPSIDYTVGRSSVKACYESILNDLDRSLEYLRYWGPLPERNRATRLAAFALLARIHLYRREYDKAGQYADSVLHRYDRLIDYNTISTTATTPFSLTNDELIMYGATTMYSNANYLNRTETVFVDSTLMRLYDIDDLRRAIYFIEDAQGRYTVKRGHNGSGLTPFNGFAVDEVMLIKAECLVRDGNLADAADIVNNLLVHRYKTGTYTDIAFSDQAGALAFTLTERRKELVWRCLRWDDIKRLNKEGMGITLMRKLGGQTYELEPNSPRYVFNIPQDEINRSGIAQNRR